MKALFETPPKPVIPVEFGKQMPDWGFQRKHGERNCDGMIHKGSIFDPKNGAWVMCTRKAKHTDEISGLQFCARHMKRRPPNTCTHAQAIQIQAERAIMWKQNQELLRAGQKRPFLKLLDRQQKLVEKHINREWGAALSWLSKAVANSLECWVDTLPRYRENRSDLGTTLHMLHGQACALARAIVKHCRSGELQSAIILWRSLFEIEVNMAYIAKATTQVTSRAKRYYDWNMANYLYVNGLFSHETMIDLQRKYKGWNLKHHDGWTAPPDNKWAILDVTKRALHVGYTEENTQEKRFSTLDVYNLCHSYVHNNKFGMLNDPLTSKEGFQNGPSIVGLNTPICLTALSLTKITHLLLDNQPTPEDSVELSDFRRLADIQESQVLLEVEMIRPELLSPLGGIDLSFTVQSEDGTEYIVRPARRGEY